MHLLPFLRWIAGTPVARAIDDVEWAFPVIESIHILGMALLAGTIAAFDLRVLGMGLRSRTVPELARDLQPLTLAALGVVLVTGPLLFSTDPIRYSANPAFAFKMRALLAAVVVQVTLLRRAARSRKPVMRWGKPMACLTLALWVMVICAARWIATY